MTNLTAVAGWDNVPQIEITTPLLGGAGGPLNTPAQALANRTEYLRRIVSKNVFEFMTDAQKNDVIAKTYTIDVAEAIDAAVLSVYNSGGGTVILPAGGYLLGTTSTDANNFFSYVTLRDGVSIVGAGMNATILKVKGGENARISGTTGPNGMGTLQATPLKNCTFRDFTFDWNGENNLLSLASTPVARNNAAIISYNGGINITCRNITIANTPGNQCIFFPASSEMGQGNIHLVDCVALNSGSGLPGNYNLDHSSFYCNGTGLRYENLRGDAPQRVAGALFELHGSDAQAVGCYSNNYALGYWIASNYSAISGVKVSDGVHLNVDNAFSLSGGTYAVNDVEVSSSTFVQSTTLTPTGTPFFINGNTLLSCSSLNVHDCKFIGANYSLYRMMQCQRIADVVFDSNICIGFGAYGVLAAGIDLTGSSGRWANLFRVTNNKFTDVVYAVYANQPTLACGVVDIRGNTYERSIADTAAPVTFNVLSSSGTIGPDIVSANYSVAFAGQPAGATVLSQGAFSYSPIVSGSTSAGTCSYTAQVGKLTKVGNLAIVNIFVTWTGHTGTGGITVSLPANALPAHSPNVNFIPTIAATVNSENITLTAGKYIGARIYTTNDKINLYEFSSGAASLLSMSASGTLNIAVQYPIS